MKTKRLTFKINTHHNRAGAMLSRLKFGAVLIAAIFALAATSARASDPIGTFTRIDRVVMEPNESAPERIQLWGSFCLADPKDRDGYLAPEKGYLYYKLPTDKSEAALKEWKDLKATAGSGDVIGFGSRHATTKAKVRSATDKVENPDVYSVAYGLVKSQQRGATYPPIKALQSEKKSSEPKESPPAAPGKKTQ